jgi:hypothetical protein
MSKKETPLFVNPVVPYVSADTLDRFAVAKVIAKGDTQTHHTK